MGFGVGRVGRSIIDAQDPDKFCGIEPNAQMLAAGVSRLIGKDRLRAKRPRFHSTPDGRFEVFGGRFDFVYSRSVWTHMSKRQIELYLDGYLRVADRVGISLREPPLASMAWRFRKVDYHTVRHAQEAVEVCFDLPLAHVRPHGPAVHEVEAPPKDLEAAVRR